MASPVKFPKEEVEYDITNLPPPESSKDKFWRKMKEQPAVPIGSLLTCCALIAASNHLRKGNRDQFQKALRWRVGLQGATVVAAVGGSMYYGAAAMQSTPSSSSSPDSAPGTEFSSSTLSGITTSPGRPATNLQASRAEERRESDRAQLSERLREAMQRERENQEKEEIYKQLAAEEGRPAGRNPRLNIGKDSRYSWRKKEGESV